ncbi:MAG: 50S ribosomal protein L25 [Planctomycetota bacterium]|nr:50S ribosomal protein L25 [Planctomycetota bacterium]
MSTIVTIAAEARDTAKNKGTGTRVSRRLRAAGRVPAIIYGHKQAAQPISITAHDVLGILKRGSHVVGLDLGKGQSETVLVRELQWDYLGKEVIHIDFFRADLTEEVESDVRIELKGEAPGVTEGGVLDVPHHSIKIRCQTSAIPDSIRVDITNLHLGQVIHVKDIVMPDGVTAVSAGDEIVVHLIRPTGESAASAETLTQPEVITRPEKKPEV